MSDRLSARLVVAAPAPAIFAILVDPRRHVELDGSDMVRAAETTEPITRVGEIFRMDVHHPTAGSYQTDNHVAALEHGRLIAWRTSAIDAEPAGWEWRWSLDPVAEASTTVTLTYDWSDVTDPAVLKLIRFPVVPVEALEQTLANLAAAVERESP